MKGLASSGEIARLNRVGGEGTRREGEEEEGRAGDAVKVRGWGSECQR